MATCCYRCDVSSRFMLKVNRMPSATHLPSKMQKAKEGGIIWLNLVACKRKRPITNIGQPRRSLYTCNPDLIHKMKSRNCFKVKLFRQFVYA